MVKFKKSGLLILLIIIAFLSLFQLQKDNSINAQIGEKGYFEEEVPLNGAYLQTINCDPRFSVDKDDNGILDPGYSRDFDGDGVPETNYVEEPLIVNLAENGFYPGDNIMISRKSCIRDAIYDSAWGMPLFGLFSSSSELTTEGWNYSPEEASAPLQDDKKWPMIGPAHRVPGAIDVALGGYVHPPGDDTNTWKQGQQVENDIPEDFRIMGYAEWNAGKNGVQWTPDTWFFTNGFWITIPPGAKYLFFQVTGYWMLNHDGYCIITIDKDTDKDAIPDSWEKDYIDFNKDGMPDLVLTDANFERKDIYVEIDYMGASGGCVGHEPDQDALQDVKTAFHKSPVDNNKGINLHLELEEADEIEHKAGLKIWDDFIPLKKAFFGTEAQRTDANAEWILLAKKYTYHYCMFIHAILKLDDASGTWKPSATGGISLTPGNDFIVSLGEWDSNPGTRDEQAAVFMHELGHNLGLHHGGIDRINYKPNYLSIMNYLFQLNNEPMNRPLDFSRRELPTLEESALDEPDGLGVDHVDTYTTPWFLTAVSRWETALTPAQQAQISYLMPIDYNNDSSIDLDVATNVNNYPYWNYDSPPEEALTGWNDWDNLNFYFVLSEGFSEGSRSDWDHEEITWDIVEKMRESFQSLEALPMPSFEPYATPSPSATDDASGLQIEASYVVAAIIALCLAIAVLLILRKKQKSAEKE